MLKEEQAIEIINSTLNMNLDPKNTPADVELKSLGIDSLDFYDLLIALETATGRSVPDDDVEKLSTIRNLVGYFS